MKQKENGNLPMSPGINDQTNDSNGTQQPNWQDE
jgi:hypothetical protein